MSKFYKLQKTLIEAKSKYQTDFHLIHETFEKLGITEYCFIGGSSLAVYNYLRATEDADVLISKKDKEKLRNPPIGHIRDISDGRGRRFKIPNLKFAYVEAIYEGEVLNPQAIAFPNPVKVRKLIEGAWVVDLPELISEKLQSGMFGKGREQDIGDLRKLILNNQLTKDFIKGLRSDLQAKWEEIWEEEHVEGDDIFLRSSWD